MAPPPRVVNTPVVPAPAPVIPRVRAGGVVRLAEPIYRPEPQYPPLARQARVSGIVQLEGVIGIDGRLKELRIVSGHPLLAHAALQAVSQWIYKPTTLNGDPVEVIAPITVTFRLN
jgi:protein TonB